MESATVGTTRFVIEKFDGKSNFGIWKLMMEDLLIQQGLDAALLGKERSKVKDEDWEMFDRRARGAIRLCLSDEVIYGIMGEKTAAGVWLKLEELYMTKSITNRLYLKRQMYQLRMKEGTPLFKHINEFSKLLSELFAVEVTIEDEDQALLLLASLPSSFEHLVTTILYGRDTVSLKDVQAALLSHETMKKVTDDQRSGDSDNSHNALIVTGRHKGKKSIDIGEGCTYCKDSGHEYRDCPKLLKKTKCFRCKRYGHRSAHCTEKFVEEKSSDSEGDVALVYNCLTGTAKASYTSSDEWIIDSGCSYHMTSNRDAFVDFHPTDNENILLGDDT